MDACELTEKIYEYDSSKGVNEKNASNAYDELEDKNPLKDAEQLLNVDKKNVSLTAEELLQAELLRAGRRKRDVSSATGNRRTKRYVIDSGKYIVITNFIGCFPVTHVFAKTTAIQVGLLVSFALPCHHLLHQTICTNG